MADAIFNTGSYTPVPHTAAAAITAGDIVVANGLALVAHHDIAEGAQGSMAAAGGIYTCTVTSGSGTALAQGEKAYWDAGNSVMTDVSSGNTPFGFFAETGDADNVTQKVLHWPF